jgi:transposase
VAVWRVIELSQKQLQRLRVVENAVAGYITVPQAAELLDLSERQVQRLKGRCQPGEVDWVRHGNWGRPKPWGLREEVRQQVLELARGKYAGFNDSHLTEKLREQEDVALSRETVRRILRGAGMPSPQKRRPPRYRSRRERKARFGLMVLADASREDWLEGRGPLLTLLGFQDDATGQVLAARFQVEYEDTLGYLRLLRMLVQRHGVPLSLYRDQHGTFQRNDKNWTPEEELAGRQTPTHLGRVLEELGIQQIPALSPQAKGRIERLWRTFQDRLRSELRLAGATTPEEANRQLETFIQDHNRRFAKPAREAGNDFRPLSKKLNWDRLFSLRYERVVGKDHVIPFGAHPIQLPSVKGKYGYAGQRVELSHQLNGELHVWLGDQRLYQMPLGLHYTPGAAPRRPATAKRKLPRIYVYAGRPAVAIRP